jgi:hypothetical protein
VKENLLASSVSYTQNAWQGTARLIDTYARQWQVALRESCIDTKARKSQGEQVHARREVCFSRLRSELDTVTGLLATKADTQVVRAAVALAEGLDPVSECSANRAPQKNLAELPDAEQESQRWKQYKSIEIALALGNLEQANTQAAQLLDKAASDDRYQQARVLWSQGQALHGLQSHTEAVDAFENSFYAAVSGKHDRIAAQTAIAVFDLYSRFLGDPRAADQWRALTQSAVERANQPEEQALWLRVQGLGALNQGDVQLAEQQLRASLAIAEDKLEPNHSYTAEAWRGLGHLFLKRLDPVQAEAMYKRALSIREAALGSSHPALASLRIEASVALVRQARLDEARRQVEGALAILVSDLGGEHERVVDGTYTLATVQLALAELGYARQTLEALLPMSSLKNSQRVDVLLALMQVDQAEGKSQQALERGQQVLSLYENSKPTEAVLAARVQVAEAKLEVNQVESALADCESLLETLTHANASRLTEARTMICLARANIALKRPDVGRGLLARALKTMVDDPDALPFKGQAWFARAQLEGEAEDGQKALEAFGKAGPVWQAQTKQVEAWLQRKGIKVK